MKTTTPATLPESALSVVRDKLWDTASLLLLASHQRHALACVPEAAHCAHYCLSVFGTSVDDGAAAWADAGRQRRLLVSAVGRALDLLEQGRYGWCDACGAALNESLLRARPQVLCCPECEAALKQRYAPAARSARRQLPFAGRRQADVLRPHA